MQNFLERLSFNLIIGRDIRQRKTKTFSSFATKKERKKTAIEKINCLPCEEKKEIMRAEKWKITFV